MNTLDDLLDVDPDSPEVRRALALVQADRDLMRRLIAIRKKLGMSQQDVADLLGLTQPTIASFERYDSDPKLSTVRRYAQAVGALVCHHVQQDAGQIQAGDWPPACHEHWQTVEARLSPTLKSREGVRQVVAAAPHRASLSLAA